jgi:hypothetical protein
VPGKKTTLLERRLFFRRRGIFNSHHSIGNRQEPIGLGYKNSGHGHFNKSAENGRIRDIS